MSKISLVLFSMCSTLLLNAQKAGKQPVTYHYLRNPLERLDPSIKNYSVGIEIDAKWVEGEKQKQKDYESDLAKAEEEYRQALNQYNSKSTGKKILEKVALGKSDKPIKRHVEKPILTPRPDVNVLTSKISLGGYGQGGEDLVLFKVIYQDIYASSAVDKGPSEDNALYQRFVTVKTPVKLQVTTPDGKTILNQVIESSTKDIVIKSKKFRSKSDWKAYLKSEWEAFYRSELMKHYDEIAIDINNFINSRYGYSKIKRETRLFMGKGKKHSYETHLSALRKAQRAYEALIRVC